jgi:shikimate kinase
MKRNVVLIGYRCSGKTSVGSMLAREWGRGFSDTDALIEKYAGCSVEEIVKRYGWERFRAMERRLIEAVSRQENLVIASGGGAVMDERNVKNLKRNGADPLEEIHRVLPMRDSFYGAAADIAVDTSGLSVREVADKISKALAEAQDK